MLLLLLIVPHTETLEVVCDTLEVNTVYDPHTGKVTFTQLVIRDNAEIRDWRMLHKSAYPQYDHARDCYVSRWIEGGRMIEVRSAAVGESVTWWDVELVEREWLPDCQRKRVNR